MDQYEPGDFVRHHSGSIYEIISPATNATNGEAEGRPLVVYKDVKDSVYVRDAEEFYGNVTLSVTDVRPRFSPFGKAPRISAPQIFMNVARQFQRRGTCQRRQVGAIAVDVNGHLLSEGYNGALPKMRHCNHGAYTDPTQDPDLIHSQGRWGCVRAVHAEINIVTKATRRGTSLDGAHVYVTVYPCIHCLRTMISAGVKAVTYDQPYWEAGTASDPLVAALAEEADVPLIRFGA
jgi:dCMP deaminase